MIRQLQTLGLFTASTALSIALIDLNPVQAASFEFTMGYDESNYGALDFDLSPLKGSGTETISFNQLYQYWDDNNDGNGNFAPPEFYYSYFTFLPLSESPEVSFGGSNEDAIFTFSSGKLVGIELDNNNGQSFNSSEGRSGPPYYYSYGFAYLSFEGANTEVLMSYDTEVYDLIEVPIYDEETGEIIDYELQEELVDIRHRESIAEFAPINFQTIEPIEAVPPIEQIEAVPEPEPLTMLGTATAIGVGAFFKRKLFKK